MMPFALGNARHDDKQSLLFPLDHGHDVHSTLQLSGRLMSDNRRKVVTSSWL